MRYFSIRELLHHAKLSRKDGICELHPELVRRYAYQQDLAKVIAKTGTPAGRTLSMMTSGIKGELESLDTEKFDAYHRGLRSAEERAGLTIPSVVDVLAEGYASSELELLLRAHVGTSLLIRHHLTAHALHMENSQASREMIANNTLNEGVAREALSLEGVASSAAFEAKLMAGHAGVHEARVDLQGFEDDPAIPVIPHHLSYVILELLKNAFQAHLDANVDAPVVVRYKSDGDGRRLEIIDEGIGAAENLMDAFATLRPGKRYDRIDHQTSYATVEAPLQGYGIGLCLARLHAEHFLGNRLLLESQGLYRGAIATIELADDLMDAPERPLPEQIPRRK